MVYASIFCNWYVRLADMNMSISTTVEEGGEKTGVESDERLSPHSLPGGFTGPALMVVLQSTVFLPGHFFLEAFCFVQYKLGSAENGLET